MDLTEAIDRPYRPRLPPSCDAQQEDTAFGMRLVSVSSPAHRHRRPRTDLRTRVRSARSERWRRVPAPGCELRHALRPLVEGSLERAHEPTKIAVRVPVGIGLHALVPVLLREV